MSLGSFIAGLMFNSIGGSATFQWFSIGALVFLVVHVLIQKVYARFAGSIGKSGLEAVRQLNHDHLHQHHRHSNSDSSKVVYIGDGGSIGGGGVLGELTSKDSKRGTAATVLLSPPEEDDFREVPLK